MPQYLCPSFNLNISLACHACGITMNDLYEACPEGSECGLIDGTDNNGMVTKLWMTSCHHVICHKHLPGGLVPFHPEDEYPMVNCPICPSTHDTPLFWIRGTNVWERDEAIPSECFKERVMEGPQCWSSVNFALGVHCNGAKAAAKLYAAQTQIAADLLYKSEQRITVLEQENAALRATLRYTPLPNTRAGHEGLMLPPKRPRIASNTATVTRGSLKRGFDGPKTETRNLRRCLPERGILQVYGSTRPITASSSCPEPRIEELDKMDSPAFSTPRIRTQLSPVKTKTPELMPVAGYQSSANQRSQINQRAGLQTQLKRFDKREYI